MGECVELSAAPFFSWIALCLELGVQAISESGQHGRGVVIFGEVFDAVRVLVAVVEFFERTLSKA